jgi:hypothetical protein
MKVLSVRQPYAALLVLGVKRLEARGRATSHRGPLLIHASSAAVTSAAIEGFQESRPLLALFERIGWTSPEALRALPRSAIIGSVDLVDSIPSEDFDGAEDIDYELAAYPSDDVVYWLVNNAKACHPVAVNGKLNVWDLPGELEEAVQSALMDGQTRRPAWAEAPVTGAPFVLRQYHPVLQLANALGGHPRTFREIVRDFIRFAEEKGLMSPTRVRVDSDLSFLAPGRKFLSNADVVAAIREMIAPVDAADSATVSDRPTTTTRAAPSASVTPVSNPRDQRNSSRTRVAPVFDALRDKCGTEGTWIGRLLGLAVNSSTPSHPWSGLDLTLRSGYWGDTERGLQPPVSLLSWLVRNFSPSEGALSGDGQVEAKRRSLAERDPETVEEALALLRSGGTAKAWYILEGPTVPDVFLVTNDALVVVEGKRTESGATTSTTWMSGRHQMLRHIDAAWEIRAHRRVFGLMIVEGDASGPTKVPVAWTRAAALETDPLTITASLPHRGPEEQRAIANAFIGVTSWQAVVGEFGLPESVLPDIVR